MKVLSLHAVGHDTCLALFDHGELVFAIETERITRVKHDFRIQRSFEYAKSLIYEFIRTTDVVVCSTNLDGSFVEIPEWQAAQRRIEAGELHVVTHSDLLGRRLPCIVVAHEAAHAAIGLQEASWRQNSIVLVNEGHGSFSRNCLMLYKTGSLRLLKQDFLPWYATGFGWTGISALIGLGRAPSAAGKTMALAAFNDKRYDVREELVSLTVYLRKGEETQRRSAGEALLCEITRKLPKESIASALAWGLQSLFTSSIEKVIIDSCRQYAAYLPVLSGGCALNLPTNTAVRTRYPSTAISPACNDSGQAIGAALYAIKIVFGEEITPFGAWVNGVGAHVTRSELRELCPGTKIAMVNEDRVAEILADGMVVANCQGVSAIGPRSLGERSLLGSPAKKGMKRRISQELKEREFFRPLAPIMTDVAFLENFPGELLSPYMLYSYENCANLLPEASHVDGTARIQTLEQWANPLLYGILRKFENLTGVPGLINTSLNRAGRAIAYSPRDALDDFWNSDVDAFILGDYLVERGRA